MKIKIKEKEIDVEPIEDNAGLKLALFLSTREENKFTIDRQFLESLTKEILFYNKTLRDAGIFPLDFNEVNNAINNRKHKSLDVKG